MQINLKANNWLKKSGWREREKIEKNKRYFCCFQLWRRFLPSVCNQNQIRVSRSSPILTDLGFYAAPTEPRCNHCLSLSAISKRFFNFFLRCLGCGAFLLFGLVFLVLFFPWHCVWFAILDQVCFFDHVFEIERNGLGFMLLLLVCLICALHCLHPCRLYLMLCYLCLA